MNLTNNMVCYFIQKCLNRVRRYYVKFLEALPYEYLSTIGIKTDVSKTSLKNALVQILGKNHSHIKTATKAEVESITTAANLTMNGILDVLGSSDTRIDPISWNIDIKTGHTWSNNLHHSKQRLNIPDGADIKVPWEISRGHHLLWLGEAFLLTNDERYAKRVIDSISNWIETNRFMHSVNWCCAMEVAIRAVNWMYALLFVSDSKYFTNQFAVIVLKSLYQHGFCIYHNLEKQIPYSNNHYASNIVGLIYLGALFIDSKRGKKWYKFAKRELFNEIRHQTLPSGVHYEKSISYHRLMVELFAASIATIKRLHNAVPEEISLAIAQMKAYAAAYITPSGIAPLIGDNDDGRFLPFVKRPFNEHYYLVDENSLENRIALMTDNIIRQSTAKYTVYRDAGCAILKNDYVYVYFCNCGYSKYPTIHDTIIPTHTHNDLLSFVFSFRDKNILIDPGTYVYTSNRTLRNEFRSTRKHNTIMVDAEEQNLIPEHQIFHLVKNVQIGKVVANSDGVSASYTTLLGKLHHERRMQLKSDRILITDILTKDGKNHNAELFLHFNENYFPIVERNKILVETDDALLLFIFNIDVFITIKDDFISPSYGILKPSKTAIVGFVFHHSIQVKTEIAWTLKKNTK